MARLGGTAHWGGKYWCVKTLKTVSKSGQIYMMADGVEVHPTGALLCCGGFRDDEKCH